MRVLVTGAGGQLGGDLREALVRSGHEAAPASRTHGHRLDIADAESVESALRDMNPDAIVNCAAWTAVDAAEADADGAYRANALGPRILAAAANAQGVPLMHISTDFVFDGNASEPIDEWAAERPLGVYGASKLAGEREVRALCPRHQIVRTAWLYGRNGPNFVLTMLRLARERGALRVVADQHGSPTWTGHLAPALVRLVELGIPGTYHLANSGATTWHGFASAIVEEAGLPVPVTAIATDEYPTPARRPAYSVLDARAWRLLGEPPLPDWRVGLRAYLDERGERR
jgi:dTDP-4-dehydrorhamnose reductase